MVKLLLKLKLSKQVSEGDYATSSTSTGNERTDSITISGLDNTSPMLSGKQIHGFIP